MRDGHVDHVVEVDGTGALKLGLPTGKHLGVQVDDQWAPDRVQFRRALRELFRGQLVALGVLHEVSDDSRQRLVLQRRSAARDAVWIRF